MKLNQVRTWTRGGTRKTAHRVSPRKISSPRQKFGRLAESIKIGKTVIFASEKNIKTPPPSVLVSNSQREYQLGHYYLLNTKVKSPMPKVTKHFPTTKN